MVRQALAGLASGLLLLCACALEQDAAFCRSNDDCAAGEVCSSFTRSCTLDLTAPLQPFVARGELLCCHGSGESTAKGFFETTYADYLAARLELDPAEAPFRVSSDCGVYYEPAFASWVLNGYVRQPTASSTYVLFLLVEEGNLQSHAEQTAAHPTAGLATIYRFASSGGAQPVRLFKADHGRVMIRELFGSAPDFCLSAAFELMREEL